MKKWFLYSLSYKGDVFYVGISTNILLRYKYHCSFPYERTHNYICRIRHEGNLPDIHILNEFETQQQAETSETSLIRLFVSLGHKLCNDDLNPSCNRILNQPLLPNTKRLKRNYASDIIQDAFEKYNKLRNYYANEYEYNRLQQMGNSAIPG